MLELPKFDEEGLRLLVVCVHVDLPEDAPLVDDDEVIVAKVGGKVSTTLARKIVDIDGDSAHYHFEAGVESAMPPFGDPGAIEDVLEIPAMAQASNQSVTAWARFRVTRSSLPENGMIRQLSSTPVPLPEKDGYELRIAGCTMEITGNGPVRELKWWPVGTSDLTVEITMHQEMAINDQLLLQSLQALENGLRTLVHHASR